MLELNKRWYVWKRGEYGMADRWIRLKLAKARPGGEIYFYCVFRQSNRLSDLHGRMMTAESGGRRGSMSPICTLNETEIWRLKFFKDKANCLCSRFGSSWDDGSSCFCQEPIFLCTWVWDDCCWFVRKLLCRIWHRTFKSRLRL